jgi:serine/threonine protein kinase
VILVELMGPEDLGGFLARKRPGFNLGRPRIYSWLGDLLRALDHLHDRDPILIHRDVKPENLLLTRDRRSLKLADFGLAKAVRPWRGARRRV